MGTDLSNSPVCAGLSNQNRYNPLLYCKFHTWKRGRTSGSCVKSTWYPDAEYTFGKRHMLIQSDELSPHVTLPPEGSALILVSVYNLNGKPYAVWTVAYTSIPGYMPADLEPDPVLPSEWLLGAEIQAWAERKWSGCKLPGANETAEPPTVTRPWQAGDSHTDTDSSGDSGG